MALSYRDYGWVARPGESPMAFFSSSVVCAGETLKVVVPTYGRWDATHPTLSVIDSDKKGVEAAAFRLDERHQRYSTAVTLRPGQYQARVAAGRSDTGQHLMGEHEFVVLDRPQFDRFWRDVFSGPWDEPLRWNQRFEPSFLELLDVAGLRADAILGEPHAAASHAADDYALFLFALVRAQLASETTDLPFNVYGPSIHLPDRAIPNGLDLTKLVWLLGVVGPCWSEWAFFAESVGIGFSWEQEALTIRCSSVAPPSHPLPDGGISEPRLHRLVREGDYGHSTQLTWGRDECSIRLPLVAMKEGT
jgi:hypothetical protein